MKTLIHSICFFLIASTVMAAPPATGDYVFSRKDAQQYTPVGITPTVGSLLTWDGGGNISQVARANLIALGTDTTGNYVATVTGTANEISVSGAVGEGTAITLSLPAVVDLGGKTLVIPYSAAPTLGAAGRIALDTNWWGTDGAILFDQGGAVPSQIVSVNDGSGDLPTTGQTAIFNGTNFNWGTPGDMLKSTYDQLNVGYISGKAGEIITGSGTPGGGGQLRMQGGSVYALGNGGTAGSIYTHGGTSNNDGIAGSGGNVFTYGGETGGTGSGIGGSGGSIMARGGASLDNSNGGAGGSHHLGGGQGGGVSHGGAGGSINTDGNTGYSGGNIYTYAGGDGTGGSIDTSSGGGNIVTGAGAMLQLGLFGQRLTLLPNGAADYTVQFPGASGTLVLDTNATITFVNAGLRVLDTNASHYLTIQPGSDLTQNRVLTVTTGDAARTLSMGGNITTASSFTTSGAFALTLTATATTNATIPSGTITLVDLATAQSLSSKTIQMVNTGLRVNDTDASHYLQITPGSNLTNNRVLTLTTGDAARTWTVTGDLSITNNFATVGGHTLSFTTVSNTAATFPAGGSITLVDTATSQALTNKALGSGTTATASITYSDGVTQVFNPNSFNAGINVGSEAGNPGFPADGDLWYNSATGALMARMGSTTRSLGNVRIYPVYVTANDEEVSAGTARGYFRVPIGFTLTAVRASLYTTSSSGDPTFDINESGSTVLGTKLSVDAGEKTSATAASSATITDSAIASDAEITVDVDLSGTGATGAIVYLIGYE